MDDDAPIELLWQELRTSPLWKQVETLLLEKRDTMVAKLVVEERCEVRRGPKGDIATEDPGLVLARIQRKIGYIEAVNAILKAPADQEEKARKARIGA